MQIRMAKEWRYRKISDEMAGQTQKHLMMMMVMMMMVMMVMMMMMVMMVDG